MDHSTSGQRTLFQCPGMQVDVGSSTKRKRDSLSSSNPRLIVNISSDGCKEEVEVKAQENVSIAFEEQRKRDCKKIWQDSWLESYPWLIYDDINAKLFCRVCKDYPHAKSAYAKHGSTNFKTSNLKSHARTQCHKDAHDAMMFGKKAMREGIQRMNEATNDALLTMFRAAYFVAKENLSFSIFPSLLSLLKDVEAKNLTTLYNTDRYCAEFIYCIAKSIMNATIKKVQDSPWFGLMVDESTDIATHHHMIIYLSYLERDCVPRVTFYGMIRTSDGTAKSIYDAILVELSKAKLDVSKLVAFGSDGCSTMIGGKKGVATLLKKVNPFLTSVHCVAHRTNLAVSNVAKKSACAKRIDKLVNSIASYFSSSSMRLESLKELQEELDCKTMRLQRIHEIRWLSRHNAISRLCMSLDAVLVALKTHKPELYAELSIFESVYILHFLADILGELTTLSKKFQKEYLDVTLVSGFVRNAILCIEDDFIDERCIDINATQVGIGGFPIIPDYGPEKGYLYGLRSTLRGDMLFAEKLVRDIDGSDLNRALQFQISFSKAICHNLEKMFVDNSILSCIKILVPSQHPTQVRLLKEYGISECQRIADFYGIEKVVGNENFAALINADQFKRQFRIFKRQVADEWARMTLVETTNAMVNNEVWRDCYSSLLCISQIALVQCCSTATCERGFSFRTRIKTKWRNRMEITSLDALMKIAIEGPDATDPTEAMSLWSNRAHRHLFSSSGILSLL